MSKLREPLPCTVVALFGDPARLEVLRRGADQAARVGWGSYRIRPVPDAASALAETGRIRGAVLVVDLEAPEGRALLEDSRSANRPREGLRVLAYVPSAGVSGEDVHLLVDGRVNGVIRHDEPAISVASTLAREGALGRAFRALNTLRGEVPDRFLLLFKRALPLAVPAASDDDATPPRLGAKALARLWLAGSEPHHLARELSRAGLPSPGWIARWLFVLHAAAMREQTTMKLYQVASRVGLDSGEALRKRMRRLVDLPPSRVGTEILLDVFRERSSREKRPGPDL